MPLWSLWGGSDSLQRAWSWIPDKKLLFTERSFHSRNTRNLRKVGQSAVSKAGLSSLGCYGDCDPDLEPDTGICPLHASPWPQAERRLLSSFSEAAHALPIPGPFLQARMAPSALPLFFRSSKALLFSGVQSELPLRTLWGWGQERGKVLLAPSSGSGLQEMFP